MIEPSGGSRPRPVTPTAAVRLVDAAVLSLRLVEARLAFWPLQSGWVVTAPVRTDVRLPEVPTRYHPTTEWRDITPLNPNGARLYLWRAHLVAPIWQYVPMRLQVDAVWLRPARGQIEGQAVEVRGPWVFEITIPEELATVPPRRRPAGGEPGRLRLPAGQSGWRLIR